VSFDRKFLNGIRDRLDRVKMDKTSLLAKLYADDVVWLIGQLELALARCVDLRGENERLKKSLDNTTMDLKAVAAGYEHACERAEKLKKQMESDGVHPDEARKRGRFSLTEEQIEHAVDKTRNSMPPKRRRSTPWMPIPSRKR
jgi:cysteine sulfinate desulfinase/cysteine desulfurase-like protein